MRLPAKPFGEWTFAEVSELAEQEPVEAVPGTNKTVESQAVRLKREMMGTGANKVAELDPEVVSRHAPFFSQPSVIGDGTSE